MYDIFAYHLADFYGFHVGKYTSPMDFSGIWNAPKPDILHRSVRTPRFP